MGDQQGGEYVTGATTVAGLRGLGMSSSAVPKPIGPYKILDELGEGGFGVVYLAEQQQPVRRRVALKVIKPGMDSRQVLARFAAEQQTLALMNHPGVAQVYDAGLSDEGRPYFAMELVIGEPIHHYCDRRRLPIDKRVELFIQVCDAVQHAHMKGVIHRDLKPGNILVESTEGGPRVKVIDFGVSKALHAVPGRGDMVTEQGQMLGTPEFMSPEQAGGGTELIDTRSDVYSLGVVLYHILTGALPFETARLRGGGPQNIVRVIREEEPAKPSMTVAHLRTRTREHGRSGGGSKIASSAAAPTPPPERDGTVAWRGPGPDGTPTSPHTPLSEIANKRGTDEPTLRKRLRGDLDWIVMTCLEKDPARRYDSASALGRDLRRYLERLPVSAGPPSAGYQLTKFLRRNKLAVSAAGLVAAALVVGLAGTTFGLVRANEAADLAARRAEDAKAALEFQAEQLGAIDPQSLGASIVSQLESLLAAGVEDAEIREAMLAELPGLNGTDIARRMVAEGLFDPLGEAIGRAFRDRPGSEAFLRVTLSEAARKLSLPEVARSHAERAVELELAEHSEDHKDVYAARNELAMVLHDLGETEQAEAVARDVLARRRANLDPLDPATLDSMSTLVTILRSSGEEDLVEEAGEIAREAVEQLRSSEDVPSELAITTIGNLAAILTALREYQEAEPLHEEAARLAREDLEIPERRKYELQNNLGSFYVRSRQFAEAEATLRPCYQGLRRVLGDTHETTTSALSNFALSLAAQRKYGEAADAYSQLVAARRTRYGLASERTIGTMQGYVLSLVRAERFEDAISETAEIERLDPLRVEIDRNGLVDLIRLRGEAMLRVGRLDEAIVRLREGHEFFKNRPGRRPAAITTKCAELLTEAYIEMDRREPGEGWLDEAERWRALASG